MALNQTQRDHAIKMIEAAIAEKTNSISADVPSKKEYIKQNFDMAEQVSIKQIFDATDNRYYSGQFSLMEVLGCEEAYSKACDKICEDNKLKTAGLDKLKETLKGEIMFGNDYSIIVKALEDIALYK